MKPTSAHNFEEKLLEFAYGDLSPGEAHGVEAHVKECARCTQTLESIQGVRRNMSQLPMQDAPSENLESLMAYAEQAARKFRAGTEPPRSWWQRAILPATGLAALVFVVFVGRSVHKQVPSIEQTALKASSEENRRYDSNATANGIERDTSSPTLDESQNHVSDIEVGTDAKKTRRLETKEVRPSRSKKDLSKPSGGAAGPGEPSSAQAAAEDFGPSERLSLSRRRSLPPSQASVPTSPSNETFQTKEEEISSAPAPADWREYSSRALRARKANQRTQEVSLLYAALDANPPRSELPDLLGRLCDALASVQNSEASSVCQQVIRDHPKSAGAELARRWMSRWEQERSINPPAKY